MLRSGLCCTQIAFLFRKSSNDEETVTLAKSLIKAWKKLVPETGNWINKKSHEISFVIPTFILFFLINNFYLEITWLTVFLHYCLSYVSSGEERRTQGERGGQKEGRKGKEKGGILPQTRFFRQVGQELNESIFFCVCLGRT